jgi:hypothetical protein
VRLPPILTDANYSRLVARRSNGDYNAIMDYKNSAYVYVIGSVNEGLYKIGVSRNPIRRLKNIQASNPTPLALVAMRYTDRPFAEEKRLHTALSPYRRNGEWFKLIPEQVSAIFKPLELIEDIKSEPKLERKTQTENDCETPLLTYDTARQMLRDLRASISR